MSETVGIRELQQHASKVVARVVAGEEIEITERGRPVARLVPIRAERTQQLVDAGRLTPAKHPLVLAPLLHRPPGSPTAAAVLAEMRADERYVPFYLDTSAVLKLIVAEEHSGAVRRWARPRASALYSSDLLRTEGLRAARRLGAAEVEATSAFIGGLPLVALDARVCIRAGALGPPTLRSLDALHLAAAMVYEDDLEGIVTYDERLAEAARAEGVAVIQPT